MFGTVDPRSPTPLYEQIAARVRTGVATGELPPGTLLPSVRQVARDLRVNPSTVVKAYNELTLDGFVEMRHGAGTFVLEVPVARREEEIGARAIEIARQATQEAAKAGISAEALTEAIRRLSGSESVLAGDTT